MTIRTVLAAASGGSATGGTLELACQIARRFEAHIEVIHVVPDPRAVFAVNGEWVGLPPPASLIESVLAEGRRRGAEIKALFARVAAQHGIAVCPTLQSGAAACSGYWHEKTGYAPLLVSRRARFFDLAVLGRSERVVDQPYTDTIEETLSRSGRPLVLAPATAVSGFGKVVAIGWNGSPASVRALAASVPFLAKAEQVWLLTAGDPEDSTYPAVEYLAWQGIAARHRDLASASARHVGRLLLETALSLDASLFVMGGYGQAPWRELVFGGVTRDALTAAAMPLFLMH